MIIVNITTTVRESNLAIKENILFSIISRIMIASFHIRLGWKAKRGV